MFEYYASFKNKTKNTEVCFRNVSEQVIRRARFLRWVHLLRTVPSAKVALSCWKREPKNTISFHRCREGKKNVNLLLSIFSRHLEKIYNFVLLFFDFSKTSQNDSSKMLKKASGGHMKIARSTLYLKVHIVIVLKTVFGICFLMIYL